jgi:mono/diheme cytochrome c family protein
MRRAVMLISGCALVAVLAASPGPPKSEDGPAAHLSKAPRKAQLLQNPFSGQAMAVAAGRKLYDDHCAQCHGADGRGRDRAIDLHSPAIQSAPDGILFWALRNGRIRKGMPSWASLPDQQLWQMVTYLKTLK